MGENMNYPDNPIDFIKQYSFSDKQQVYTNGSELISVFRVGQMIEHYMSDLTPQQIKDMQFCLREKSRECAELRRELQELKNKKNDGWIPVEIKLPPNAKHEGAFCPKYQVMTKYGVTEGWYNPNEKGWYVLIWFMTKRYLNSEVDFDKGDVPKMVFLPDEVNSERNILIAWKEMELYRPERSDNHDGGK